MNMQLNMRTVRGFGLVEVMIALVLASFLMLGLATMVSNVNGTYNSQSNFAAINDKERFASTILHDMITPAGYYSLSMVTQTYMNSTALPTRVSSLPAETGANYTYVAGQGVSGMTGSSASVPDQLNVRFQSVGGDAGSPFDCMGNTAATLGTTGASSLSTGVYESQLSVDTTNNNLVCQISSNGTLSTAVVLIDGISNMKVLYGKDTQNLGYVSQYVPASSITGSDWFLVRSVQVTLTFAPSAVKTLSGPLPAFTQTFQLKYSEGSR